jgi:cytochrome c oxidase subunit 3
MAMAILLVSLAMLFAASLVGYVITRTHTTAWIAPGMPPLPKALWLSTGTILLTSGALEFTRRSTRKNRLESAGRAIGVAWVLGVLFVLCQVLCWVYLGRAVEAHTTLYPFTFYFLTGLHAVHVLAGFVPLAIVTRRLGDGEYSSSRHDGLGYCVQYWHFLGVVWLILFLALLVGT